MEISNKSTIEIIKYGDFDMAYTHCILVNDEKYNPKQLKLNFLNELGVNEHTIDESESGTYTELFIEYLLNLGFKKLHTTSISF